MKVLFITQYFIPEPGAGTARVSYHAKYLKRQGHDVTVLCGVPNYPTGRVFTGYTNSLWQMEIIEGIKVYRTFLYPTNYTSSLRRFLNYFSFTVSSFLVGIFLQNPDVIISSSPPPSAGISSLLLSYIKRKPLIFEVRDVWPGAALELGYLKNKLILELNLFLEKRIYKRSKYIIAPTEATKDIILAENTYLSKNKVKVVTNGVDLDIFDSVKSSAGDRLDFKDKFVVIYTGTLGLQQGVKNLVGAAKILKSNKNIIFLVIGEGADKHLIRDSIRREGLKNIILKDMVSYLEVVKFLKASSIGLTILKKNKYLNAAYPVKAFDYMAASKPIIVCGGEAMGELVEKNSAGVSIEPNPKTLALAVERMASLDSRKLTEMGQAGRNLAEKNFNRKKQAAELMNILNKLNN